MGMPAIQNAIVRLNASVNTSDVVDEVKQSRALETLRVLDVSVPDAGFGECGNVMMEIRSGSDI